MALLPNDVQVVLEPLPAAVDSSQQTIASMRPAAFSTIARDTIDWVTTLDPSTTDAVVRAVHALGGAVVRVTAPPDSVTSGSGMQLSASMPRLLALADDPTLRTLAITQPARRKLQHADTTSRQEKDRNLPLLFDATGAVASSGIVSGPSTLISHPPEQPTLAAAALARAVGQRGHSRASRTTGHRHRISHGRYPATMATVAIGQSHWSRCNGRYPHGADVRALGWLLVLALVGLEWILRRRAP